MAINNVTVKYLCLLW